MRLSDLTPEQRENLSAEEIVQITSTLSCDERLHCSVLITPIMRLVAYLHNSEFCEGSLPKYSLEVLNLDYWDHSMVFQFDGTFGNYPIKPREILESGVYSVNGIVKLFGLDASVKWQAYGVYKIVHGDFQLIE